MKRTAFWAFAIFSGLFLLLSGFILLQEKVSGQAYKSAFAALESYQSQHPEEHPRFLAVVDYSKPSFLKRMAVIDLKNGEQTFYLTAHGLHSGDLYATRFSNAPASSMSSLGLYKTLGIYTGDHGKAIRLMGLDGEMNSNAFSRDIVLHSADYVSLGYIVMNMLTLHNPKIGRSNGCFVVPIQDIDEITQKLNQGAFVYAWAEHS